MARTIESGSVGTQTAFVTTHWSVVLAAARTDAPRSREAWEQLARSYWLPLYAYIRRSGHNPEDARDLTQSFFVGLIERQALEGLVPEGAKFRSFLLTCLNHFLADHHRHSQAACRRPEAGWLVLDGSDAESRCEPGLVDQATPETLFERRWAETVLDRAVAQLEAYYVAHGKRTLFDRLVAHLAREPGAVPHAELAAELHTSEGAVRNEMYRLRQRFRVLFREEVAATVSASDVDEEMRHLFRVLTQS